MSDNDRVDPINELVSERNDLLNKLKRIQRHITYLKKKYDTGKLCYEPKHCLLCGVEIEENEEP